MNEQLPLSEWLAQNPLPEEIRYNEDGSAYLPIEFVKPKLYYLDGNWGTQNFAHQFIPFADGKLICSGSVELLVEWNVFLDMPIENLLLGADPNKINKRIITGSATFFIEKYLPNMNWGATCLSLCIVNAAKELGTFFGKDLNKEILTVPTTTVKEANDRLQKTLKKLSAK